MSAADHDALIAEVLELFKGDTTISQKAIDGVQEYTRAKMREAVLPFTGRRCRGIIHLLMPPVPVFTISELKERGWPCVESEFFVSKITGETMGHHQLERGALFYEVLESVLSEAHDRRLVETRQMTKGRWQWYSGCQRAQAKVDAGIKLEHFRTEATASREAYRAGVFGVFGRIVGLIDTVARIKHRNTFLAEHSLHQKLLGTES